MKKRHVSGESLELHVDGYKTEGRGRRRRVAKNDNAIWGFDFGDSFKIYGYQPKQVLTVLEEEGRKDFALDGQLGQALPGPCIPGWQCRQGIMC